MRRRPSAQTASIGVTQAQLAVERNLGWLFREQPTEDYGIDAHMEVVDEEMVRGRLLAIQIKSGQTWFKERGPAGWWFRPHDDHVRYWIDHSLPTVVVLYHPDRELCYWQLVTRETLVKTPTGGWKLLVPESQVLDENATVPLAIAAAGDPYALRVRELQLARPWMRMLADGTRLVIDIEEWVNKTSGRGSISLGIDHEDGKDPEEIAHWTVFLGLSNYVDVVPKLFAWANVSLHEETYEYAEDEFSIFGEDADALRPYRNGAGEVDFYRFELTLNELGRSFMVVDQFAGEGSRQLTK
ncbi:DUF4365 domain-containing protein [Streptomyces sp. NPDC048425]|uniref:DUF4365 domain-containing protein n=1 Tax=Streptomyces sp. NPDC048425 TaxID=3365548 RepID=UPI00371564A7